MSLAPHRLCKPRLLVFSKSLLGLTTLVLGFSFCLNAMPAWAQDKAEKKADEEPPPPPEEKDLATADGLELKATYYPGTKGQESIPVILVHGFNKGKGNRKDFTQGLAPYLQEKLGCFVIVPDLRGYGESTKLKKTGQEMEVLDDRKKKAEELKDKRRAEDLKKKFQGQVTEMVTDDLRAVKDFLWKKNNEKALNLDKLTVIGVEEGAAVALSYAAYDAVGYEQQEAQVGPLKLGKFVKSVVLISPVTKFKGSTAQQAMKLPEVHRDMSVMIVVGNKLKDHVLVAEQLNNMFKKARPSEDELKVSSRTLFYFSNIDTALQGCKLLDEPSLNMPAKIAHFLQLRLVDNQIAKDKWVWRVLKFPHE